MRKSLCLLMVLILCLAMAGCSGSSTGDSSSQASVQNRESAGETGTVETGTAESVKPGETSEAENTEDAGITGESRIPVETLDAAESTLFAGGLAPFESVSGVELNIENQGKVRITYTHNQSSVSYITSPDHLPDHEELAKYDAAFFEHSALVLVVETVNSGSVQVGIESITVDENSAVVTLSHKMPGDVGTNDMACWLLWAEVEAGLDCSWTVANPALPPAGEKS